MWALQKFPVTWRYKGPPVSLTCCVGVGDLPQPDLLDHTHQQGVHVVVQLGAHLHVLDVVTLGDTSPNLEIVSPY